MEKEIERLGAIAQGKLEEYEAFQEVVFEEGKGFRDATMMEKLMEKRENFRIAAKEFLNRLKKDQ